MKCCVDCHKIYRQNFTDEHRKKLSESHKGKKQSIESIQKRVKVMLGHPTSELTRKKIGDAHRGKPKFSSRGKNNWNYKGTQKLNRAIRGSTEYKQWRSRIFERDNWTCQTCRKRGCYIEAHHVMSVADMIIIYRLKSLDDARDCKEFWNLDNGVTLCFECHKLTRK